MTDETKTPEPEKDEISQDSETPEPEEAETAVATAESEETAEGEKKKLQQSVEIKDIGPCKKHIKVSIEASSIQDKLNDKFSELVKDAIVPGFRKGKAPRRVIERQFQKDVGDQVKGEILMASLEQLADDFDVAPLSPPDIRPNLIQMPKDKEPLVYEFDVEVRPEFELPEYKGLTLKRPVKTFTEAEIDQEQRRLLSSYGQLIPKEGQVESGDFIVVDLTTRFGEQEIGTVKEATLRVDKRLAFKDGVAEKFAEQVVGANVGDTKIVDIRMADQSSRQDLAGHVVQASLEIKDVKTLRLPELTHEFLHNFSVHTPEQLRELIQISLEKRLEYQQRQSAREQILQHIESATSWELPQDLLARQARRAMNRRAMEMQEAGMSEEEIRGRLRVMQQDILKSTASSLKEHFVLQKIAEEEKIDINEEDIQAEIDSLADQYNESPRRLRARLEKEDSMETLAALLIERKALNLILGHAHYEDVPLDKEEGSLAVSEAQAVSGEMRDITKEAEEASAKESQEQEEETKE
ncbi:MAG: trigger factor [Bdellovibrionales bacterium]